MKKKILLFLTFLICANIIAGERDLKNVPREYTGTYLPVDYINLLQEYKCQQKALLEIAPAHYEVLMLEDSKCYSSVLFADGFAVLAKDFEKWSFNTDKGEKYITDENGFLYKQISKESSEVKVYEFVLNFFFGLFPKANAVIKDNTVKIDNKVYSLELHPNFPKTQTEEYALMLYILDTSGIIPEKKDYFVFLDQNGFKIVKGINEDDAWHVYPTEEIIYSYKK